MLDLVERDVLQPLGVSFLRLDGGVEPAARFSVVQRFNADPTIDVLLLTTQVGVPGCVEERTCRVDDAGGPRG